MMMKRNLKMMMAAAVMAAVVAVSAGCSGSQGSGAQENAQADSAQDSGSQDGAETEEKESGSQLKVGIIQLIENGSQTDKFLVAIDTVGAGIGEYVLVTQGSSARLALVNPNTPVDAVVVGIIDESPAKA